MLSELSSAVFCADVLVMIGMVAITKVAPPMRFTR